MASCTADTATITLYQRLVFGNSIGNIGIGVIGAKRCIACCDSTIQSLGNTSDDALQCINPQLVVFAFTVTHHCLIHAEAFGIPVSPKLDLLLYLLEYMSSRWILAQRLERVIRTAAAVFSGDGQTSLPNQFYDAQYTWPDINNSLQKWFVALSSEPSSWRQNANVIGENR